MDFEVLRNYLSKATAEDEFKLASRATEEICNFLDQNIEKLDDNNVFDAYCLLVQIAVYSRDNPEIVRNEVEALYSSYAINSETSILEFYQLGEAIACVTRLCSDGGPECLRGCRLSLPFCRSSSTPSEDSGDRKNASGDSKNNSNNNSSSSSNSSSNRKVIINISTLPHLFAIQRFWCNVLVSITSMKFNVPIDFNIPKCIPTVMTLFSYLNTLDTISSTVKSVCSTVITILNNENNGFQSYSVPISSRITIALDILNWLSGILTKLTNGLNRHDLPALSACIVKETLETGEAINTLLLLLINCKTVAITVGVRIIQLLQIFVAENHDLLAITGSEAGADIDYFLLLCLTSFSLHFSYSILLRFSPFPPFSPSPFSSPLFSPSLIPFLNPLSLISPPFFHFSYLFLLFFTTQPD